MLRIQISCIIQAEKHTSMEKIEKKILSMIEFCIYNRMHRKADFSKSNENPNETLQKLKREKNQSTVLLECVFSPIVAKGRSI